MSKLTAHLKESAVNTTELGLRLTFSLLLMCVFLLGNASTSRAGEFCSDYGGVIDGSDPTLVLPTQITIDRDCTFQNFPPSDPLEVTVNFQTNDPSIYLIIFNNVTFTGHMACASVDHRIWFSNGADYGSSNSCQDLFIPVESIDKESPAATAAIGEPFTYTLTLPSMSEVGGPSANDLHTVTLWDDLSATGVDLSYVDHKAYYKISGDPVVLEPESNPNAPGGVWTPQNLSFKPIPLIRKNEQIVVEMTVVLEDTPRNAAGVSFSNTAKWWFGRLIDGVFYEPLPGEWGISQPITIAEPDLVVTKTSDETALNLGVPATFTLDVQNTGGSDVWNATILDILPDGASAGMCDYDPRTELDARIVEADGTLVSSLASGTDYSAEYSGCQLSLSLLTEKAKIGPDQHLIVTYQSQLDADSTGDGLALTNIAGVTQWFSAASSGRIYTRTLTDGTPGIADHQDNQTVTTALSGYFFQKTVENLTSHEDPATTASPGDRLRYRLRLFNVDQTIDGITIEDPLDASRFDLTTFQLVSLPAGATHTFDPTTGLLTISGDTTPLNVAVGEEIAIEFEIEVGSNLVSGTVVSNQANLSANALSAPSDDPFVNGIAAPGEPADPTEVLIQTPGPLAKATTQASATIGERFSYRITVPAQPTATPLYDVRILDDLAASSAELRFVRAEVLSGGSWTLRNSGTETSAVIEDTITGIDIPAHGQAVVEVTVELLNTAANMDGLTFTNSATYTYNRANGDETTRTAGGGGASGSMTVAEPDLAAAKTVRFASPAGKPAGDAATVGDVLEYAVTLTNGGRSTSYDTNVIDELPANVVLIADAATATIGGVPVSGFIPNPILLAGGEVAWGRENGDNSLDIPAGQTLVLTYQARVESITGEPITNRVFADWTSLADESLAERTGAGCPSTVAPNDYCTGPATVPVSTIDKTFLTKSVVDDSYVETPASIGDPVVRIGDTVIYELTLNLQEYTTRNVVVEDALPQGLALESFTVEAGATFSTTLAAQPGAGATGTLRWEFGTITNQPSGDGTPLDPLVIRYVARVLTDAPTVGVGYETSLLRQNLAKLSYTGGDPALYPDRLTASAPIEVRQPQMSATTKVDLGSGRLGSGTSSDPYQVNLATDVMNFRLSSCNDGLAPAYGVVIRDLLAPELDETDLSAHPPTVVLGGRTLVGGIDYTLTAPARGGEMRIALQDSAPVSPGECVTVDYDLGFHTDLTISRSWSNEAQLSEYRSLPIPESGRLYPGTAPAQVWMTNLVSEEQLLKTLVSPASGEATVGQEVVYRMTVPAVPVNATLENVVVTDTLHDALAFVGATATLDGASLPLTTTASGQALSWSLGTLAAGEQAVITLTARVANNDQAQAGTSFANAASYTFTDMPPELVTGSASRPLTVVEPAVTVARSASTTTPQPGEVLTFTLHLAAAGGEAGDTFSGPFDLALEESLDLGLAYEPGSAAVNGTPLADPLTNGADGTTAAQTLTWSPAEGVNIDVPEGETATVSYRARVLDAVAPGQILTGSAVARWTGLEGDQSAVERTGSGTPAVNDYFTAPSVQTLSVPLAISFVKSVVNATTGEDPGANARPGDTLRYNLVLANESIVPVTDAVLTDDLSASFAAGSLKVIDAGGGTDASDPAGGANGTGRLEIRDLTLGAQGEANDTLTVVFEATLHPVLRSGTAVVNGAEIAASNLDPRKSNETSTRITSAPLLEVWKSSTVLDGDPVVLMPGERLRYTLRLLNVGSEDAANVLLRDGIPANTAYVPGSTTLNGRPIPDPAEGVSPLREGLPVTSPGDVDLLRAEANPNPPHAATVTFEVAVDPAVMEGLIIENQGFASYAGPGSGPQPEQPSDDPDTPVLLDPTRDVVGSLPLLLAQKTVQLQGDAGSPGIVDPLDVLLYTIAVRNSGGVPATGVTLSDVLPPETTYLPDSLRLNGAPLGPDGGAFPLAEGLALQSLDGPGEGILSAGSRAVVTFEVRVNSGVSAGTVIRNQGSVASAELPPEPTDADGLPSNGHQPTEVVVGDVQRVSLTKEVRVVGGGIALPGGELEYIVRATNTGSVPATNLVLTDDLASLGSQVSFLPGSATLNGSAEGISFSGSTLAADVAATYGVLPSGAVAVLRFRVQTDPALPIGTTLINTAFARWSDPALTDSASVSLDLGGTPGSGGLNGRIWHDGSLNKGHESGERPLQGWSVGLYRSGQLLTSVTTDAEGNYRLQGLVPNEGMDPYELRFLAPGAGPQTASLGTADSPFTDGPQRIRGITVGAGGSLQGLNLPLSPNGTVYDSVVRVPVSGARLTVLNAGSGSPLPEACFEDPAQQNQVTAADGFYKFDLNFSDAACPAGGGYLIEVTPPATGYRSGPSQIIPPPESEGPRREEDPTLPEPVPFDVAAALGGAGDVIPETTTHCEISLSPDLPPVSVAPRTEGTLYHLHLRLSDGLIPGESQAFNNHIPLDPELDEAVAITKTSPRINVSRAELVPYTITVNNVFGVPLYDIAVVDRFPAGFKYVEGSARLDGAAREPRIQGRELVWEGLQLQTGTRHTLQLLLVVGSGVSEGEYVNRAQVINTANGGDVSGEATATVRVVPDPTFDCTDVIGKVFDDRNLNGRQEAGEEGLPGVRVVTARGLIGTTDPFGRFHITCAATPDEDRGSNFILKLDDRTLPTGFRMTTENPRVQRATRGKMLRFNFGATIHRVVGLDLADGVFEPDSTQMRLQWKPRIGQLLEEVRKTPCVLRLSYLADVEGEGLVRDRLRALKEEIIGQWKNAGGGYRLTVETEVFWRRGGPPQGR